MLDQRIEEIKNQFKEVIKYSQNIDNPAVDDLFEKWLEAKRDFIELFDGELIKKFPNKVIFELSEEEKNGRLKDFIDSIEDKWCNLELARFMATIKNDFFNNLTSQDYQTPDGRIIKKGTKIIKAFKFFEKDKIILEDIQNEASRIIQEDKIEGYLYFSVHPLDFLSSSENSYNWRSCHSLDGEYRAGNLSYMLDNSTFMVYLSTGKMTPISNFPDNILWNSKKWRTLLFLSEDWKMLFAGRQYPFASKNGINLVLNYFSSCFCDCYYGAWNDFRINSIPNFNDSSREYKLEDDYIPLDGYLKGMKELVTDNCNENGDPLHYNDLLYSSCYKPIYSFKFYTNLLRDFPILSDLNHIHFNIGGVPKCLRCGKGEICASDTMQCFDCFDKYGNGEDYEICDNCGHRIKIGGGRWVDDFYLCNNCVSSWTHVCDRCGNLEFDHLISYNRKTQQYLCRKCKV